MRKGTLCRQIASAALSGLVVMATPGAAFAQLQRLPGAAEPGRAKPPRLVLPVPPTELDWSVELPPGAEPPESLKAEKLTLKNLVLDGVTVYRRAQLADLFKPYLGKEITFGQFYGIAKAIQLRYRKDGYILSFAYVPPQTVENGVFHIAVVEGFVERVIVPDVDGRLKKTLEHGLAPIVSSKPLNVKTLERYLLLANDLAGIKVTGVLRPSPKTRGGTVLVIKVRRKPVNASMNFDNRASEFAGPLETSYDLSANSLLGTGERVNLGLSEASAFSELTSFRGSYQQPIGGDGLRFDLGAEYSESQPGFTLASFNVETETTEVTADLSYPLIRSREENLSIGGGFTFRNTAVDLGGSPFSRDRIRLARANATYNRYGFLGGSSSAVLGFTQAFPILDATDSGKDSTSRADANPYFSKGTLDLVHSQPLIRGLALRLSATAQYSRTPTVASEEFSLGGASFGRAYNAGEVTGEDGFGVAAELSYQSSVKIPMVRSLQLYGFYDFGKAWDRGSGSQVAQGQSLSSAGAGIRVAAAYGFNFRLEFAYPLTKQPSNQPNGKDGRVFFFTGWSY